MKKFLLIVVFSVLSIIIHGQGFVYLENEKFKLNGNDFYPIVMNYCINVVKVGSDYYISPEHSYGHGVGYECNSESDCLISIRDQLQIIKDRKFNCIRLCGISVLERNNNGKMLKTSFSSDLSMIYEEEIISPYTSYFELIEQFLDIAENVGLKVIVLTGISNSIPNPSDPNERIFAPITIQLKYADFLKKMATYFSNNTTLMAYDICNEPAYHRPLNGNKTEICSTVSGWIDQIKLVDENHLVTVGYSTSGEVMGYPSWDPSLIPVDFVSFHPYPSINPYNVAKVENEIYWYKNNIEIPWIIGETGISNLVETPSFDEQVDFVNRTLRRVINCNGVGYSWWQYSDTETHGGTYNEYAYGIVNNYGTSITSTGQIVEGALQPFAYEFADFVDDYNPDYNCPCLPNYYNEFGYDKYVVTGEVKNASTNQPIEGAVVYGWDEGWGIYTTKTNSEGIFNLYSNSKINTGKSLAISGVSYSVEEVTYSGEVSPVFLQNKTISIGSEEVYNTSGTITCSNFNIAGNGATGGNVTLFGGNNVIFQNYTSAAKGAYLKVEPKTDYGGIQLNPLSSCNLLKSAKNVTGILLDSIGKPDLFNIQVYPNPTTGLVNIKLSNSEKFSIELFDSYGKLLIKESYMGSYMLLDVSSFLSGIYLLRVETDNGYISKKIILEKNII